MNQVVRELDYPGGKKIQIVQGDITLEDVDAVVNAANRQLQHGAGVAGAIARRGGQAIQEESSRWVSENGPVSHDRPAVTGAGNLPARYVIHAVGPVWGEGDEDRKLAAAVAGSLRAAEDLGLRSLAMPAISTGVYHFPKQRAAEIIVRTIRAYFEEHPDSSLELVRIVLFDQDSLMAFLSKAGGEQELL